MRKRVLIALALLLVALAGVIAWQGLRQWEPVYQGKTLSVWIENLIRDSSATHQDAVDRDLQAIRHIGTNALPVLIERVRAEDTPLKQMIMKWAQQQKLVHLNLKSANQCRFEALWGYWALGPLASAQVPSLSDTLTNDSSPIIREVAAVALGDIGTEAKLAASALFRAAKDMNGIVRQSTFWALGQIRPDPQLTIPVLVAGLDDPIGFVRRSATDALGKYGPEANLAAPALFRATKDTDEYVRGAAFSALGAIRADPHLTIPILVAGLDDPDLEARIGAAEALVNYGSEAKTAVPALLWMLATNNNPAGLGQQQIRSAAVDALKAIDPEAAAKAGVK